jgi:formate dehydrogenase maturation protein FdhE
MTVAWRNKVERDSSADRPDAPSTCPACGSGKISTAAKNADVNAYWRCDTCGEVWNVARRAGGRARVNGWR